MHTSLPSTLLTRAARALSRGPKRLSMCVIADMLPAENDCAGKV